MSEINTDLINTAYPVAGRDNSTQGFRDNYLAIKTALDTAHDEITALENNTAKLNVNNEFLGTKIIDAELAQCTLAALISEDPEIDDFEVDWQQGQYQQFVVTTTSTITLKGWPAASAMAPRAAELRLYLINSGDSTVADITVTFQTLTNTGTGLILYEADYLDTIVDSTSHCYVFTTLDGGETVYARLEGVYS